MRRSQGSWGNIIQCSIFQVRGEHRPPAMDAHWNHEPPPCSAAVSAPSHGGVSPPVHGKGRARASVNLINRYGFVDLMPPRPANVHHRRTAIASRRHLKTHMAAPDVCHRRARAIIVIAACRRARIQRATHGKRRETIINRRIINHRHVINDGRRITHRRIVNHRRRLIRRCVRRISRIIRIIRILRPGDADRGRENEEKQGRFHSC
jgi:hypothetical protein